MKLRSGKSIDWDMHVWNVLSELSISGTAHDFCIPYAK